MPFKSKADYNKWRKNYRDIKQEQKCCVRCYKPLIEEHTSVLCVNCHETNVLNSYLRRNFNGDN